MYFLYFLQSNIRKTFYIGSSSNPEKRLMEHNNGSTKSTRKYKPWKIIYIEEFSSKSEACKREWHLKHPKGYLEKRAIIEQYSRNGGVA